MPAGSRRRARRFAPARGAVLTSTLVEVTETSGLDERSSLSGPASNEIEMSLPLQLFSLQQLDTDLDRLNARLAEIRASREESDELVSARKEVERRDKALRRLEAKLKDLEWTVSDLTAKIERNEGKLYGGRIQNPKELDGFRREVEIDRGRRSRLEDETLEDMATQEEEESVQLQARERLAAILGKWKAHQVDLTEEESELNERAANLASERGQLIAQIPAQSRSAYERLRGIRRGLAVATIDRNNCGGCRIALPVVIVQRVRRNNEEVHCPSCGRFLVLGT